MKAYEWAAISCWLLFFAIPAALQAQVDDFDEALTAMSEAGYEIIKGPLERADGQRAFYVYDPEGNRVEFTTKSGLKSSERVVDENGYTTS